jgi:hypothetical protein
MLQQAAIASARQAVFACRDCSEPVTTCFLSYAFRLAPNPDCLDCISRQGTVVTFTDEHVTVQAPRDCRLTCDPALVRSARCLWLWRCGVSDGCRKWEESRRRLCEAIARVP